MCSSDLDLVAAKHLHQPADMVVVGVGENYQVDRPLPKWQRFPQFIGDLFRAGPAINEDMLAN